MLQTAGKSYRDDQEEEYASELQSSREAEGEKKNYKTWKTFQMSDHLVMWVELRTDFADQYLQYLKRGTASDGEPTPRPTVKKAVKKRSAKRTKG